jgi:hypothetical protein
LVHSATPKTSAFGSADLIHRLVQVAGDVRSSQHAQRLARFSRNHFQIGFHMSLHTDRSPGRSPAPALAALAAESPPCVGVLPTTNDGSPHRSDK